MTINNNTLSGRVISTISTLGAALTGRRVQVSTGTSSIPESLKGLKVVFQETFREFAEGGSDEVFRRAFFEVCGFTDAGALTYLGKANSQEGFHSLGEGELEKRVFLKRQNQTLVDFMCKLSSREGGEAFIKFFDDLEMLIREAMESLPNSHLERMDDLSLYKGSVDRLTIPLGSLHYALFHVLKNNAGSEKSNSRIARIICGFICLDTINNKMGAYADFWDIVFDVSRERVKSREQRGTKAFIPCAFGQGAEGQRKEAALAIVARLREEIEVKKRRGGVKYKDLLKRADQYAKSLNKGLQNEYGTVLLESVKDDTLRKECESHVDRSFSRLNLSD